MADIKITNLPLGTDIADDDELLYIDVSDQTAGPDGTDKRVLIGSLRNIAERNATTEDLIASDLSSLPVGKSITTVGFYESGDGGGAQWVKTADTDTPSQTPADMGDAKFTDSDGSVWGLVNTSKINPRSLGATGEYEDNSYPHLLAAWNAINKNVMYISVSPMRGGVMSLGKGVYRVDTRIEDVSDTTNQDVDVSIIGDGQAEIVVNNQDGFLKWHKTNYGQFFKVHGVTISAGYSAINNLTSQNSGTAIELQQATSGDRKYRHYDIRDVVVRAVTNPDAESTDYFNNGVLVNGGGRAIVDNLFISGVRADDREDTWLGVTALSLYNHYGPEVKNSKFWGFENALIYSTNLDPGPEGGTFTDLTLDAKRGFTSECPSISGEPGLDLQRVHCNCGEYGMKIKNRRYVNITDCLLYNETYDVYGAYNDIILDNVSSSTLDNLKFEFPRNTLRTAIKVLATSGSSDNIKLSNTDFDNFGIGLSLNLPSGIKATGFKIGDNVNFNRVNLTNTIVTNGYESLLPYQTEYNGTPEGVVIAPVGSIVMRTDGGSGTSMYVKESGIGNTGWVAK